MTDCGSGGQPSDLEPVGIYRLRPIRKREDPTFIMPRVTPNHDKKKPARKLTVKAAKEQAERRRKVLGRSVRVAAVVVAVGSVLVGYNALAAHVRDSVVVPGETDAVSVVLDHPPTWMSETIMMSICERIAEGVAASPSSRLDPALLDAAVAVLEKDPWVAQVGQVRRLDNRLYVDCSWRRPAAVVHWPGGRGDTYHLVAASDDGAVLLPLTYDDSVAATIRSGEQIRADGVRIVTGVNVAPPDEAGTKWRSEALVAALATAQLLHGRDEATDVTTIDVAGVSTPGLTNTIPGDSSPVVLGTRYGTSVYWGGPPNASDFLIEPRPEDKLANLAEAQRVFATSGWPAYVDLRQDQALFPRQTPAAGGSGNEGR